MPQSIQNYSDNYDAIAAIYDSLFTDKESQEENRQIAVMLKPYKGSFYDLGCGTGLLLELIPDIKPMDYRGVDPSAGMLDEFIRKYPQYEVSLGCHHFESDNIDFRGYDNVISLFGSASYVCRHSLKDLAESECKLFMMFYKPDYYPVTYKKTGTEFRHFIYSESDLADMFNDCSITMFNNFLIISRT